MDVSCKKMNVIRAHILIHKISAKYFPIVKRILKEIPDQLFYIKNKKSLNMDTIKKH